MEKEAYKQYLKETKNWLHEGRRQLLKTCIGLYCQIPAMGQRQLRVLEIGAGSGKNLEVLSIFGIVDAIEIESMAIEVLTKNSHIKRLFTKKVPFDLDQKYDIICAMDFLEHVENDSQVFSWMVDHLNNDGILFLTVPAYPFLFSYHDQALGHYRRYMLKRVVDLNEGQLSIIKKGYFNTFLFPIAALLRIIGRIRMNKSENPHKKQSSRIPNNYFNQFLFQLLKTEVRLIKHLPLFPFGLTAFALFKKYKYKSH